MKADLGKDWHDKLPKRDEINWTTTTNANIQAPPVKIQPAVNAVFKFIFI